MTRPRTSHPTNGLRIALGAAALGAALWPRQGWAAGCGPLDVAACADGAEYSLYAGLAGLAWTVDRTLLQLAYQLDQLRWWLVQVAFTSAYQQLTRFISPLYVPVTTVALTIACLLFMLVPFTGRALLSIRQVILWAILTPLLVTVSGQLVAQTEQIRSGIGSSLFTQASAAAPGAIFGVSASDMADPHALYPANPCGTGQLTRQATAGQLHMDDLAAALLYADAGDIHCPDKRGPGALIPDRFYGADPGFATAQYVSEMATVNDRRAAVEGMQRGLIRLAIGLFPCLLAVCEMLVHLVFALSLAVVWVSLPIGLIFVAFQGTSAGIGALLRRIVTVLQVSWSASFVMGLLFAALLAAAELGNAAAYVGFSLAGILLTGYLAVIAFGVLRASFGAVSTVVESGTGLALQPAVQVVQVAAVGGVAAAAVGALAGRTGSTTYAASAVIGRVPGMMELGEVAAGMGWLPDDQAIYRGMRAGFESTRSWRSARTTIERDTFDGAHDTAPRPAAASAAAAAAATRTTSRLTPTPPPAAPLVPFGGADLAERVEVPGPPTEIVIVDGEVVVTDQRRRLPARQPQLAAPALRLSPPADSEASRSDQPADPVTDAPGGEPATTGPSEPQLPTAEPQEPLDTVSRDESGEPDPQAQAVAAGPASPQPPARSRARRRQAPSQASGRPAPDAAGEAPNAVPEPEPASEAAPNDPSHTSLPDAPAAPAAPAAQRAAHVRPEPARSAEASTQGRTDAALPTEPGASAPPVTSVPDAPEAASPETTEPES